VALHELQAAHQRFQHAAGGDSGAEGGLRELDACLQARGLADARRPWQGM